jgi:hypothetical protein
LQESHIGAIFSPVTFGFIMWPPRVGVFEQPFTEQLLGQDFFDEFSQCFFQEPQLQDLPPVPPLLDHPFAVMLIDFSLRH